MLLISIFILFSSIQGHVTLDFSCNFEDETMCAMQNSIWFDPQLPLHNFTIVTGENVPDKALAPTTDHTYNTSSGHYAYWHQPLNSLHTDMDGCLSTPIFELQKQSCLTFAYYIKSLNNVRNGTLLFIRIKEIHQSTLWSVRTDDTLGWQTDEVPLISHSGNVTIWFTIMADLGNSVSVALDDINVDICARYRTTTTPIPTGYSTRLVINTFLLIIVLLLFIMN
ncbi:hypothetical protein I4U23_005981 [Adineta vaga]|nr:hypothetical protein I4U23_005981 [Adineta vaga]